MIILKPLFLYKKKSNKAKEKKQGGRGNMP